MDLTAHDIDERARDRKAKSEARAGVVSNLSAAFETLKQPFMGLQVETATRVGYTQAQPWRTIFAPERTQGPPQARPHLLRCT